MDIAPLMNEQGSTADESEVRELLRAPPYAAALRAGAALFVCATEPVRLVFHTSAALSLFGAADAARLASMLFEEQSQGARQIRRLAAQEAESAPSLQLLRFFAGRLPVQIGVACALIKSASGARFLFAVAPDKAAGEAERNRQPAEPLAEAGERFVWSSDADGRISRLSENFAARLGAEAPTSAETLDQWRRRLDAPNDAMVQALETRATFRAVPSLWPDSSGDAWCVALLSGAPLFDRERRFAGFRGFGVLTGASEPRRRAQAVESQPAAPQAEEPREPAAKTESRSGPAPEPTRGAEIVPLRAAAPQPRPNVVPLRPGPMRVVPPDAAERGPSESVALTSDERDAFREIALALGARMRSRAERAADTDRSQPAAQPDEPASAPARDLIDIAASAAPSAAADAQRILDALPSPVLVSRGDETLYVNAALLDLLGYRDAESFARAGGVAHMFGRDRGDEAAARTEGAVALTGAGGAPIEAEGRLQKISWAGAPACLLALRPLPGAGPAVETQALEQEARRLEAQLLDAEELLDRTGDGSLGLDAEANVLWLSPRAERVLGAPQHEAQGAPFANLLRESDRAIARAWFDAARREAENGAPPLLVSSRDRPGGAVPLRLVLTRSRLTGLERYLAAVSDLSPQQTAAREAAAAIDEARRANAMKTDMLSAISHEIRTPLNAILGFAEVMRDERFGPVGNERYKQYVADIHFSGQHVLSLVNDLLDLARIEAGRFEVNFASLDANRIIQECAALMQPHAARERVIMRLSLCEKLPPIVADERSLRQIALNLLSNAVKFNEPGGQVIVSTVLSETNQAIIRVRDTGVGMSESEVALALEPFRQVGGSRRLGGTGLGLPLTKALVEANKAEFSIHSRKEQGTLVELTFPIAHAAAAQ